jgi:hypothetical protein
MQPPVFRARVLSLLTGIVACGVCRSCVAVASELPVAAVAATAATADRPVSIRVQWGGGKPQAWSGTIAVARAADPGSPLSEWRTLCSEHDAAAMMHDDGAAILVHEPRPVASDGVELVVRDIEGVSLRVQLGPAGSRQPAATVDVPLADVIAGTVQQPLDGEGNRLTIKHAAGDALRISMENASGDGKAGSVVRRPGERIRFRVDPLLAVKPEHAGTIELRLRLKSLPDGETHDAQATGIVPGAAVAAAAMNDRRLTRFEPVVFEVALPAREAVCDIELEAVEVGSLRWARPLATRTVQVLAVDDRPVAAAPAAEWQLVHEVDPGSPRLHERLRRLPGVGLPNVEMPSIPLPSMSVPHIPRPNVPLPNVALPKLPHVPLPSVASVTSMVPRLSGLLTAGHSVVEPHPLGPMLRLPPAKAAGEPSWEGVVIAGAQPGIPHAVEVQFPSDQEAVLGVSVLELDAAGAAVEQRHAGGFEVRKRAYAAGPARLGVHRFVFWPTTRNPVVVIANPSQRTAAMFGKVRVLAGPARLPGLRSASDRGLQAAAPAQLRRTFAFLPSPDLAAWGGAERVDQASGRSFPDWGTHLAAARHSAEWLGSQDVAGALVPVYGGGAGLWPSELSRHAPRWGGGTTSEIGLDPVPKDLLELLCRVYGSAGLRLVPGMAFDAPLPAVEALLARGGGEAVGVACVGRDGRPRRSRHGGLHYNILDPRVQQAVEGQVRELAVRLRAAPAVEGLAVLLAHDGWLHLPGVAWGLDDATFARFLASVGAREPEAGAERFARRAEMVEGPLREMWLEWRADAVAAFHARLAGALAEQDPRWSLYIVPTTLFAAGDLAARFRPLLAGGSAEVDILRECGLDPLRSTSHPQVVFVTPHVHAAADGLVDRSLVTAANRSPLVADGARLARRHGVAIVEQPAEFDPRPMAVHGPFGAASPPARCQLHAVSTGDGDSRCLAESLVAADAETVFDMRLALRGSQESSVVRRAFESLPARRLDPVAGLPAPLVVRMERAEGATWLSVINAADAPGRALIGLEGRPSAVVDAAERSGFPLTADGVATVPVEPWGVRTLLVDGGVTVRGARIEYDEPVRAAIAGRIQDLRRRRAALEMPQPLEVLDNPGFEVGPDGGAVAGWELVEPRRGAVGFVAGGAPAGGPDDGRGLAFSSINGLSSLRSNPFTPPVTGRLSIAVWLRLKDGDPQPPLRIAVEGVQGDREYYRFAPVGGLGGGRPLTTEWAQFVLPVDDLPTTGLESLRVRFDLLGPGSVMIDDVRVFDLAFEESQRVQLSRMLSQFEQQLATRDIGACVVGLDGHWPRFLAEFVSDAAVERMAALPVPAAQPQTAPAADKPASMFDRVRGWWQ